MRFPAFQPPSPRASFLPPFSSLFFLPLLAFPQPGAHPSEPATLVWESRGRQPCGSWGCQTELLVIDQSCFQRPSWKALAPSFFPGAHSLPSGSGPPVLTSVTTLFALGFADGPPYSPSFSPPSPALPRTHIDAPSSLSLALSPGRSYRGKRVRCDPISL